MRIAIAGKNNPAYKHGHTAQKFSPEYHTWSSMWQRCTNRMRASWDAYGGRGITICDRWTSFENFLADMGPRPEGYTLDRIDNDGPYSADNCRWATKSTQNANKRRKTDLYGQDILCLIMLGHDTTPLLAQYTALHPEVVKKEIRRLRAAGIISTTRVATVPNGTGRVLKCHYTGG